METALPAGRANVAGWIQELPSELQDAKGGFMAESMWLALRYFGQVKIAAGNEKETDSVIELLEQQRRLSLLQDGDDDLDQRLYNDPKVRKLVVSNLLTLVLVLNTGSTFWSSVTMILYLTSGTGVSLFTPESKQTLTEGTNRILEQASAMAYHMLEPKPSAPVNIVEFCDSTKGIIKSRIDNIYDALFTARHPVHEFGESEPRQAKEIEHDECRPFPDTRQVDFTVAPASEYSSASDAAKKSRGSHDSRPLTDTVTSRSPSEVGISSCESTALDSTQASSREFERDEFVRVWHHSGGWYRDLRIALIDTGSDESFIRGSLVEELELVTRRVRPASLTPIGPRFEVNELVRPTWQFHGDTRRHQNYDFFVLTDIPGDRDMLLGDIARGELGIKLQQSGLALPVHEDYESMS